MGIDRGTHDGGLSSKITAMYVGTCSDELLYDVLATKGCGKMKGGVTLVVEDHIHIRRKRGIRRQFAKQNKHGIWVILSADGSDELCATGVSE